MTSHPPHMELVIHCRRRNAIATLATGAMLAASGNACAMPMQDAPAQPAATRGAEPQQTSVLAESPRGVAGQVIVAYSTGRLTARPVRDTNAPMLVRVSQAGPDRFRVEFLGLVSGVYDLAELVERDDGRPAEGLAPIPVRVLTQLPPNHGTDVFGLDVPGLGLSAHYRTLLALGTAAWILVPMVAIGRRLMRRRPVEALAPAAAEPTTRDLMLEMLEVARSRDLTLAERGRLELLLLRALREDAGGASGAGARRDGTPDELARAIASLRADSRTGALVRGVEAWLHADPAAGPSAGGPGAHQAERAAAALGAVAGYARPAPGGQP